MNHITGSSGEATRCRRRLQRRGIVYGPDGILFLARWPVNAIGQTLHGSTITDKIVALTPFQVCPAISALNFVPPGFPDAGQLKLVTWGGGCWCTAGVCHGRQSNVRHHVCCDRDDDHRRARGIHLRAARLAAVPRLRQLLGHLEPSGQALDALLEDRVIFIACLVAAYAAVGATIWAIFLFRRKRESGLNVTGV